MEPIAAQQPPPVQGTPGPGTRHGRLRRTLFVVACAAVLGIAAGTAVGYGVQARRPPVPLGTLAQASVAYPAKAGGTASPLPVSQDAGARTSGDLRTALVPAPAGATAHHDPDDLDGWLSLPGYAEQYSNPSSVFKTFSGFRFRRAADVHWTQEGKPSVEVLLVQLQPGTDQYASQWVDRQRRLAGDATTPVEGSTNGFLLPTTTLAGAGHPDLHQVMVLASRGDTLMEIYLYDPKEINTEDVQALARRQLERL
ncbi:hypothetical protein [Streptomyces sp. NBC_01497]|uniref:hypothetical protein n=1 Tax=Streptomyces sp. NBC_01497 TaxID=2903885 RepID=UPI002E3004D3|nr:hypothetical protein [Streptomyces sp. NBC_01497]